ncbi:hypothetical protein V6N13_063684 [Hibiscus sabdariffa]
MNATGPNGLIGMDASHSDGSEGVSFSLDDGVVVSAADLEAPVDVGLEQLNEVDGNETNGKEKARDEVDGNEADGNEEARDEQHENGAYENEVDLVGLYSGEETKYLDSTDVGSYETDSDGNVVPKKMGQNSIANYKFVGKYFISKLRILPTLSALREGFKKYCRPVVGLDGCFLKGSFKGEILSAMGRDCNNQIFPIAWAVVEVENRETWAWFLNNMQYDLGLGDGDGCTLLSDMQKGLLKEVPVCFPKIEYRFCARHMYANWRKVHKGGDLQLLFWKWCKETTQSEFVKYANIIA